MGTSSVTSALSVASSCMIREAPKPLLLVERVYGLGWDWGGMSVASGRMLRETLKLLLLVEHAYGLGWGGTTLLTSTRLPGRLVVFFAVCFARGILFTLE